MIPVDETSARFPRDVRQVLRATEIGLRWRDNIGPIVEIPTYLAARAPFTIAASARPLAVLCLVASNNTTRTNESGCRVSWRNGRAPGTVEITAIDVSDTAATYAVTLGLLMG